MPRITFKDSGNPGQYALTAEDILAAIPIVVDHPKWEGLEMTCVSQGVTATPYEVWKAVADRLREFVSAEIRILSSFETEEIVFEWDLQKVSQNTRNVMENFFDKFEGHREAGH